MSNTETIHLKKMTIKNLCEVPRGTPDDTKAYFKARVAANAAIATIIGHVTGYGLKNGQYGENIFFTGDFFARNEENGKVFESGKLYLPKDTADTIKSQFDSRPDANAGVEFKLQVSVVADPNSGFTYIASPIRDAQTVSRRAALLGDLGNAPKLAIASSSKKKA